MPSRAASSDPPGATTSYQCCHKLIQIGTLSEATIEVPAATDGSTLAQQVRALDAQAARRIQERDARQAARKARETQRAVARTFNALSEEPVLAPVADEDEDEEVVVEEPVPTETLCVLCREAKLGKQGCAALLRLASRQGVVTEIGIADARIEDGLEVLLEWALCRGGRRLRIKRDACGDCDSGKAKKNERDRDARSAGIGAFGAGGY